MRSGCFQAGGAGVCRQRWGLTRRAPGSGVCPGSRHWASPGAQDAQLRVPAGARGASPQGRSCVGLHSGFLAPSPSGETACFHQPLMRSLPDLTRASAVSAIPGVFTNLYFEIPGKKERCPKHLSASPLKGFPSHTLSTPPLP